MKTTIYLRQSLDRDLNKVSVDYQRTHLRKLCADKGWDDPVEYLDRNVSASKGRRQAYEALCEDIRNGAVGKVAVWDMDRLHRQPRELEDFIDLADEYGVDLANVGGDVDLSTPSGRMFARVKGSVAKYEVEQKSFRQKAANRQRAENGNPWVRRAFGYTYKADREKAIERAKARVAAAGRAWTDQDEEAAWNPLTDKDANQLVPYEAEMIRKACTAVVKGTSLYSIAQQWNAAGITSPRGNQWNGGTVKQVLTNPRNAGLAVHQGKILEGKTVKWPAIVERDEWQAVVDYLNDPKRSTGKSRGRQYLLTGIALCGACGKTLGSNTKPRKSGGIRTIYYCKRPGCMKIARTMSLVDDLVIDTICERLAQPNAAEILAPQTEDTTALRDEVNNLRVRLATTREHWLSERISDDEWFAKRDRLQNMLDVAESKLLDSNRSRTLEGLVGQPDARARFEALNLDRRRAVVSSLVTITIQSAKEKGATFDPDLITMDWK